MRRVWNHLLLFIIFSILSFNHLIAQDTTQVRGAKIEVSEKTFDFGEVPADTVVSHVFVIKNVGNDSLQIYRLKSG